MTAQKKEKPRHLGRGLESLMGPIIPERPDPKQTIPIVAVTSNFPIDKELRESLREVDISSIRPNPYQPRTVWDQQELADLADSIRANGLVQPIIVRPSGSTYELIAGERRLRAAKLAQMETIPAIVRPATDEQLLELALIENIHRTNLNPIERAKAYQNYITTFSLTQAEAASRLGEDRSVIANHLRLLDLPDEVRQMLIDGQLSMGHARAILALPTDELRRKLANRAMAGRLTVRDVERLVRKLLTDPARTAKVPKSKTPHICDLEAKLTSHLGTRVNIETKRNGRTGRIIIDFYSLEDFDRITEKLGLETLEEV
jgi:ParB family chromosome partitioning protein